MTINTETISKIVNDAKASGHAVKVRDICYVLLSKHFSDKTPIYRCLFDLDGTLDESHATNYEKSEKIAFLSDYLKPYLDSGKKSKKRANGEDISFDENLAYMLKIKKDTEEALAKGEIDKKDGLKILADITVKLNDKFNITEEVKDQMVVVNIKYNSICEACGHEIYIPTKEDLMTEYNLKENK